MLALKRKPGQKIVLPDLGIVIQVIRITGDGVVIGVEAPKDVLILREELTLKAEACGSSLVPPS